MEAFYKYQTSINIRFSKTKMYCKSLHYGHRRICYKLFLASLKKKKKLRTLKKKINLLFRLLQLSQREIVTNHFMSTEGKFLYRKVVMTNKYFCFIRLFFKKKK